MQSRQWWRVGRRTGMLASWIWLTSGGLVQAQGPDFSGMWTLDPEASSYTAPAFSGGRGGDDIGRLFITQAANGTVLIGAETNGLKAWSYAPGRELPLPVGRDTSMLVASRWGGERLVAEGTMGEMQMHEVMTLDGDRLTIEVTTTTSAGEIRNQLVYYRNVPVGDCKQWAMPCKDFPQEVPGR